MKILNLYANIGGNRKLWGNEHEITAVEIVPAIAEAYKDLYPNDTVVVGDAHKYLLEHFEEFDFIWSSPPCPTHSKVRYGLGYHGGKVDAVYPEMSLYQEIILLNHHFKGKWCIENVMAYYAPLIVPQTVGRHWYWANFYIPTGTVESSGIAQESKKYSSSPTRVATTADFEKRYGFDLSKYKGFDKRLALRDCVEPEIGALILEWAMKKDLALF